jgi:hypothetical protein
MKSQFVAITCIVLILIAFSCNKDSGSSQNASCTTTKSFTVDALPAIQTYCATNSGCHASGSIEGPGALTTYTQIYNNRTAISLAVTTGTMPKGSTMPTTAYNAIVCWISQGAANN